MKLSYILWDYASTFYNVTGEVTCTGRNKDEMNEALVAE